VTGWRSCCRWVDGPVATGPYRGRIGAVRPAEMMQTAELQISIAEG
jgi:hypothetical protein